jgi:hypothetical protein
VTQNEAGGLDSHSSMRRVPLLWWYCIAQFFYGYWGSKASTYSTRHA